MRKMNLGTFIKSSGLLLLTVLVLSACGNRFEEQLRESHKSVQANLAYLKDQLDTKQLTNALLIEKYATALTQQKTDYHDIATLLKKEGSSQGKAYTGSANVWSPLIFCQPVLARLLMLNKNYN